MNELRMTLEDLTGFKDQKTVEPLTKATITDDSRNKSTVKYNNRSSSPKYSSDQFIENDPVSSASYKVWDPPTHSAQADSRGSGGVRPVRGPRKSTR